MRRPVGVKSILLAWLNKICFSRRVTTVAVLPSALSRSDSFRSVHVGRSRFSRCCHLFVALWFGSLSGSRARRLTLSPELGFGFSSFLFLELFRLLFCLLCSTRPPPLSFDCCGAMVRTLLLSPTGDAAAPPAFLWWRRWLASSRSSRRVRPVSVPNVADHSRCRMVPGLAHSRESFRKNTLSLTI